MLSFACPTCGRLITFDSHRCVHCHTELGFDPDAQLFAAVGTRALRRCANERIAACNWLVAGDGELCASCVLTRTRPNDEDSEALRGFAIAEGAKRRLLFELRDLGLPVQAWFERDEGLAFDLLSSASAPVTTGHADGLITLDLEEAEPAHRERMRVRLREPYRTVLGHFRHEIGHYYEPILVPEGTPTQERCRELFGDDREDYQQALERYYADGPTPDWSASHVSEYATMHPWEDWAETFAHYLHVRDGLQTAAAFGVRVEGPAVATSDRAPLYSEPGGELADMTQMLREWVPLTLALNAISRSMGELDLYPFVLGPAIDAKLAFIHERVRACAEQAAQSAAAR